MLDVNTAQSKYEIPAARLGLILWGALFWRTATYAQSLGLLPLYPWMAWTLPFVTLIGTLLMLLGAAHPNPTKWALRISAPAALLVAIYHGMATAFARELTGMWLTTDGQVFLDYAARMLLHGQNPYDHSMLGAYGANRMPLHFSTPLLDGDLSERAAYPALSFLTLVPFVLTHIPSYLAYPTALILSYWLVERSVVTWIRPLILLPLFVDVNYLAYAFNGVTDTVWALFLTLMVVTWKRPVACAIFYGLACSYKQHPWFLGPFLLIRVWMEASGTSKKKWRAAFKFFLPALGVFVAINLPFILWSPKTWFLGTFEPAHSPMITYGQGLSGLTEVGQAQIPKGIFSLVSWSTMALLAWIYARHFRSLRHLLWFAPALPFWFNNRSLTSYWYFNVIPLLAALFQPSDASAVDEAQQNGSLRRTATVATAFAVAVAALLIGVSLRPPSFELHVQAPFLSWGRRVTRLSAHLKNLTHHEIEPRFNIQVGGLQPYQMRMEAGPKRLAAGAEGDYILRPSAVASEFEYTAGARLTAIDVDSDWSRETVAIPGNRSTLDSTDFPNNQLMVWDEYSQGPADWRVVVAKDVHYTLRPVASGYQHLGAQLSLLHKHIDESSYVPPLSPPLQDISFTESIGKDRVFASMEVDIDLPRRPVSLRVFPPKGANTDVAHGTLYGMRIVTAQHSYLILFSSAASKGTLADGTPYVVVPAPEEQFSTLSLDLRELLLSMGAVLIEGRARIARLAVLDYPSFVVRCSLFVAAPASALPFAGSFGDIHREGDRESTDEYLSRELENPMSAILWHSQLNFDQGNYRKSMQLLEQAMPLEPTGALYNDYGDRSLMRGENAAARNAFRKAAERGFDSLRADKGIGWSSLALDDLPEAESAFRRALAALAHADAMTKDAHLSDTLLGLSMTLAKKHDCPEFEAVSTRMKAEFERKGLPQSALTCSPPK